MSDFNVFRPIKKTRPRKDIQDKNSVQIRVRMSTSELHRIKKKAKALGFTISKLMREGALAYDPEEDITHDAY